MSVRWKPLLILSGLFLVVAVVGVIAMAWTLVPRSSQGVLKLARTARDAGRFPDAEIYYKQALQLDSKSAPIHEELADLYRIWAKDAPADRLEALRAERLDHLVKAVKFDKAAKGPRIQLLETAMTQDSAADSVYWAKEVLNVDAENTDAHYALAVEYIESRSPKIPEVKRHLKVLEDHNAPMVRRLLVQAGLAQASGDDRGRDEAIAKAKAVTLPDDAGPVDRMARLRLEALEIQSNNDPAKLSNEVKSLVAHAKELAADHDPAPARVTRISLLLEQTQRVLIQRSAQGKADSRREIDALVDLIEVDLESIFTKVLAANRPTDLQIYLTYADHLRFRQQRDRCLQVVNDALQSPLASRAASTQTVMGLHAVAVEMALSKADDEARYQKAQPHVQALLASTEPRFQGLGHLFQGAIDLEQSGLVRSLTQAGAKNETARPAQPKLRASALNHLQIAASQLPSVAEAQARYGVALVLNQEQALGRQYLQNALRMGDLDPQYQFWAAWTILQAGYPEEAAPLLDVLFQGLAQGTIPAEMKGTLHQLSGELYQARRGPGDLERATKEFEKAAALGQGPDPAVALRMAQIDIQLGKHGEALERINQLRSKGTGGPSAEQLAILILEDQGKKDEARKLLREARVKYPRAAELAGLDAAIQAKDGKPDEADRLLAEFLAQDPENLNLVMMRAQILADSLKRPKDARQLLIEASERTENSSPLVQLATLDIEANDFGAAAATIAKIRSRWKEAATGDILEGQLALKQGKISAAVEHFNEALKKDPDNKIVQFWKAQLDSRTGAVTEAAKALESIVRDNPTKEVDTGLTLMSAAQSALANLALQTGNVDDAIRRFEELKRHSENGTLSKPDRWQLITAYVVKGQWPRAKREIAAILNDPKNPPTHDERVRGANIYRQHKEDAAALAQLDYVLKVDPTNPSAVVTRSYIQIKAKEYDQAVGLLRKAVELSAKKPEKTPAILFLMLAAVENEKPPLNTASKRALKVLDEGLAVQKDALELVQAKYLALIGSGDPKAAVAFVESKAKDDPKGPFRRMLVEVYRDQKNYAGAEKQLRELAHESPDDENLAAALVQVISLQAAEAAAVNDLERERALNEKAATMIREDRARYPTNLTFLQAECDLVARRGDFTRAIAITHEIDKLAKTSTMGPMLRARLFNVQNRPHDMAQAYAEAIERNPRQLDLHILLGQTRLRLGEYDEALKQANYVLDVEKERPDGVLLRARALSDLGATTNEKENNRQQAVDQLKASLASDPAFTEGYHVAAEIELKRGRRPEAIELLREGLKANPQDATAVAQLVQLLAEPGKGGKAPSPAQLEEARKLTAELVERDQKGTLILAAAVGLHKAGQLGLALPLAEKASSMLDTPVAHLNLGDLLLSIAESKPEPAESRPFFERAVAEYDKVLKVSPNSVEAVNNKAWVMHTYLNQSQQALELAQGLMRRVNAGALPGEFYDTLGAIQEAMGRASDAEQSYLAGLRKAPEHPVLNYHFGKLIAADQSRAGRARTHLDKALAARVQLSPQMAQDADRLLREIGPASREN